MLISIKLSCYHSPLNKKARHANVHDKLGDSTTFPINNQLGNDLSCPSLVECNSELLSTALVP